MHNIQDNEGFQKTDREKMLQRLQKQSTLQTFKSLIIKPAGKVRTDQTKDNSNEVISPIKQSNQEIDNESDKYSKRVDTSNLDLNEKDKTLDQSIGQQYFQELDIKQNQNQLQQNDDQQSFQQNIEINFQGQSKINSRMENASENDQMFQKIQISNLQECQQKSLYQNKQDNELSNLQEQSIQSSEGNK